MANTIRIEEAKNKLSGSFAKLACFEKELGDAKKRIADLSGAYGPLALFANNFEVSQLKVRIAALEKKIVREKHLVEVDQSRLDIVLDEENANTRLADAKRLAEISFGSNLSAAEKAQRNLRLNQYNIFISTENTKSLIEETVF